MDKYDVNIEKIWDKNLGKYEDEKLKEKFKEYEYFEKEKKIKEFKKSCLQRMNVIIFIAGNLYNFMFLLFRL